jgi:LacI family transcriptional regulator
VLVIGSMFPDRRFLASIDKDSAGGAEILVDYLIAKKHRQFGVLVPASGLAGVDLFTDAASRRLASHGIAADSLTLRFCNGDEPVTIDRMRELLGARRRPTAIITDEEDLARLVQSAAESLRLRIPTDLEIVFEGSLLRMSEPSVYPHTRSVLSEEELAKTVAGLIKTLPPAGGEPSVHIVPVRMVERGSPP